MTNQQILSRLFEMQDPAYRDFTAKLIPNVEAIIGVRVPRLRAFTKELLKEGQYGVFLESLPHTYLEENTLHAALIQEIREYPRFLEEINRFLPYIDNWATCDMFRPKSVTGHLDEFLEQIRLWLHSSHTYTIRFGIHMLMTFYLGDRFTPEIPELAASVESREYYVEMMQAWFFATALSCQWDAVIPYLEERHLSTWVHNKTIQKCVESYRITPEQKTYLRTLKIKRGSERDCCVRRSVPKP